MNLRPYCLEFIKKIKEYYEVFIFTSSTQPYAETIVNFLDPKKLYISGILSREHCFRTSSGKFIKNLDAIKNRSLKNMVLVDDSVYSYALQINNGVPILRWKNNKNDEELKYLFEYLLKMHSSSDVREFNRKHFKLEKIISTAMEKLLN